MIHAYIGEGKGKTTAGIGLIIRAYGANKKTALIAFDKGSKSYRHSEFTVFDKLGIEYYVTGLERMTPNGKFRFGTTNEDIAEAKRGLSKVFELLNRPDIDVLVLDEILSAMTYGLLERTAILDLISIIPKKLEVIMTGRCDDEKLLQKADLITSMNKIKHYFDKGVQAREGIEY